MGVQTGCMPNHHQYTLADYMHACCFACEEWKARVLRARCQRGLSPHNPVRQSFVLVKCAPHLLDAHNMLCPELGEYGWEEGSVKPAGCGRIATQNAIEEVGLLAEYLMVGQPSQPTDGWMPTQVAGQACRAAFLHGADRSQLVP